jgi:PAS domain S-box-containing protein
VSENSTTAVPATSEVVEELLRQLVDARFVLTDRDGAVTRWSRPAEELFGWPGARMLGRQLPETLGMAESLPRDGGILRTTVRRRNGDELEVTLTLVPVGMSQSLEFNGFLEALEIAAPRGNALQQLQQSHRTVVDWIHAALRGEARLEDDDLAAGTIVAFRPLVEPPPQPVVVAEEEPFADPEPQPPAVEASRVDALEELSERLGSELRAGFVALEQTEAKLKELEGALEAQAAAEDLREVRARVESIDAALAELRAEAESSEPPEQEPADWDALREALDETAARVDELARGDQAGAQRDEGLRAELAETRAKLEALAGERIEEQRALAGELAEKGAKLEALERAMGDEHERADEARAELAQLRRELAELRSAPSAGEAERPSAEALKAIERLTARAEQAADAARSHSSRAYDASGAAEARASRAEEAAVAAEAQATRAAEIIAGTEQHSELAEQAAAEVRAQAAAQEALAADLEAQAARAAEAVTAAAAHTADAEAACSAIADSARRAEEAAAGARAERERLEAAATRAAEAEGAAERAQEAAERVTAAEARVDGQMVHVEDGARFVEAGAERVSAEVGRLAEIAAAAEREAERAREAAEAAQQAATAARAAAGQATSGHDAPVARLNGSGNGDGDGGRRPLFAKPDTGPARPPRPGFDDASHPMAMIALDGHFKELNAAFSDLVGYSEAEFAAAVWPPVMDRANLQKHRDQIKAMLAGTTDSAEVKTGYVHAQGLLVPVVGSIALVRENGEPSHFLLEAAGR